ncbi:MAG: SLC13/DASS family transporter [Oscillospiraceae bacterium]|nr:SLC13/DASS family transporter [Oscillospiraceae bacterium]
MSQMVITLLILAATIALFIWNKFPVSAVSLGVVAVLILTGIVPAGDAFKNFTNSNVIMIFATLIIGGALFQTGMAQIIAKTVSRFTKSERSAVTAVFVICAILSSLLSNTGTAATMFPIIIGLCAATGFKRSKLLLPIIIGATAGSLATIMGTPSILSTSAILEEATGESFSFFTTTPIGGIYLIVGALFFYFIGYKMLPDRETPEEIEAENKDYSDVPKWKQWVSLAMLFIVIIGMIFEKQIGISMHIMAVIGALLLVLCGVITEKQAYAMINWDTIYITAGMLTLAGAMKSSGAGEAIANAFVGVFGSATNVFVLTGALYLISNVLTQFMSNAACTGMLLPLGVSIAQGIGADPKAILIAILCGASMAFCTPMAQPMNGMVFGPGGYKFTDYFKAGWLLTLIYFVISLFLIPTFYPFF